MDTGVAHESGLLVSGRFAELEDALVERVGDLRVGRPLAPLTIVVGSGALRTHVGDLLVRRLGAVANVSIVTLARLATDLVAAAERRPPRLADVLVRERLVRRLINECRDVHGLRYFGSVGERPHFARALLQCFDDLRQARVEPQASWVRTRTPGKAADLEALYAAYCDGLASRGLMDDAALLLAAAEALRAGEAPAPSLGEVTAPAGGARAKTVLYGLYDLNGVQEALVGALLAAGADLFLPAPRAGGSESSPALRTGLAAGLEERRVPAPGPVDDLGRTAAALNSAASSVAGLDLRGDGGLTVVSVADERREVQEAVREVLRSVGAGEEHPCGTGATAAWDCAVVVPHAADAERFAAGLTAAGVPVACRRPNTGSAALVVMRLLDCLAPAAGKPFARRAVLELLAVAAAAEAQLDAAATAAGEARPLLHAAPAGAAPAAAEFALWADEARRASVVAGLEQWVERMGRRRYGLERRLDEARAQRGAGEPDDDGESVARLEARLAAARSLEDAVARLSRACAHLPERASWSRWAGALAELAGTAWSSDLAAAAGDVVTRLQTLAVVGEEVGLLEMAAVLRELATATVAEGRVGRDGVAVLTPLELRGLRFHTIVFTGLAEGGFPARGRPDPILGDAERRDVAKSLGVRLPLAEERDAEAALLFALAVEAARERLVLLTPRTDAATGRPRLPSRVLLRLASLVAGRAVGLEEFLSGAPLQPVWRRVAGRAAGDVIWVDARERDVAVLLSAGGASGARAYLGAVLDEAVLDAAVREGLGPALETESGGPQGAESARRRLDQWRSGRSERCGAYDGLLGDAARAALGARDPFAAELHPTGLERYIDCPFVYLLRNVFGLSVPQEPDEGLDIDPLEFGSLAHEILRRAYAETIAGGLDRDGTRAAVVRAWEAGCAEAKQRGVTGAELAWRGRSRMLLDDLLESVDRDVVFAELDGRPSRVEWSFGAAQGLPVSLELPGGRRVRFAGRVDRIDETPRGARVLDYKTGSGVSETDRLKARLSVQLPVYALAVRTAAAAEGTSCEHVECRYQMVTRRGAFSPIPLELGDEEREARLAQIAGATIDLIEGGVFARAARGRCDYCDVRYACGASEWARGRKRRDAVLAALAALQCGELDEAPEEASAAPATSGDAREGEAHG